MISLFNRNNTEWQDGTGSLILGQPSALIDSINRKHPKLFEFYRAQKEVDWFEDEINKEQSRLDFQNCSKDLYGAMIKNLAFQWELDSLAANSLTYVMAPFITNSDFKLAVTKNGEIENLHALTYSDIIRLGVPDPNDVFKEVMENDKIMDRGDSVTNNINLASKAGCEYMLGLVENDQELYNKAFMGLLTFYCLERMQFMASFAHTFGIVQTGYFKAIGNDVQKIMQDEFYYHCRTMEYAIKWEMNTKRGCIAYMDMREEIEKLLNDVLQREYDWNAYIYSKHSIPGTTEQLMNKWVNFNAQEVFSIMMIEMPFEYQDKNPLKYMENYLDLDKFQNANMEGDHNNYSLNVFVNDVPEGKVFDFKPFGK